MGHGLVSQCAKDIVPRSRFSVRLHQHLRLFQALDSLSPQFDELLIDAVEAFSTGGKLLIFGNGGSAADAQHVAAELVVQFQRSERGLRPALPCIALTTDSSVTSAISNDLGYEQVFARQVEAFANPGDIALGLSTSGNSPNVVLGLEAAKRRNCFTWALTGQGPHALERLLGPQALCVPSSDTARIQEAHLFLEHLLCEHLDNYFAS